MNFYDAHVHFFWIGHFDGIKNRWDFLVRQGLKGMAAIIIAYNPNAWEKFLHLIPSSYHPIFDKRFFDEGLGFQVPSIHKLEELEIFPYLDTRFIDAKGVNLNGFREAGFKGLKILYIPEEEPGMGVIGWEKFFGRSKAESLRITNLLVEQAADFGWPILFHADLRLHKNVVEDILEAFNPCPIIIPHFGFSRKIISQLMERFEHCYTDFSSLLPFMMEKPQDYVDFISAYSDRILFASDTLFGLPSWSAYYLEFVMDFIHNEETREKILYRNYARIHLPD